MKRIQALLLVAAASSATAGSIPEHLPSDAVPHYQRVNPSLATAGQPSAPTVAKLKEMGFRTVVNLRRSDEAPEVQKEKAAVEAQGLRYIAIPVTPDTFSPDDVTAVQRILEDETAAPVLLHCSSANRVGAVWGVIERRHGRSLADAEAEARKIGLSSPAMIDGFRKIAEDARPATESKTIDN